MPQELKGIQDFYNPQMAMQGLQAMQFQQHLGLQQQQMEQNNQNMEIDNFQKAYTTANPMETYPIVQKLFQKLGLPVPDVNHYYANTQMYDNLLKTEPGTPENNAALDVLQHTDPRSRKVVEETVDKQRGFLGMQEMGIQAGVGGSENIAAAAQQNPAIQHGLVSAIAQSPLQQEEYRALAMKRQEHEALVTRMKPEMNALATLSRVAARGIENATPLVQQMQPIEEKFLKDQKRLGSAGATSARDEAIAINPALAKFHDDREKAVDSLQAGLDALHQKEDAASLHLQKIGLGTENLQEGESLEKLQGDLSAIGHQITYTNANLAMAKDPTPANLQAVSAMKTGLDDRLKALETTKASSEEGLAIRRNAQVETARKNQFGEKVTAVTNEGQRYYAALPDAQQTPQAAARIAVQLKTRHGIDVATEDIMKGTKNPNKPLVEFNYDKKQSVTEAGQLANVNQAISEIQDARQVYIKPDGSVDRAAILSGSLGLPFTEGRSADMGIRKAVEIKLRAATGAVAPKEEVKNYLKMFAPSNLDSDELIKYKLDSFENWMQTVADTTDPLGKLRQRSNELMSEGTVGKLNSPEFKMLRQKFPQQSTRDIMEFLKKHQAGK